jgi:Mg2+/Co2+ transporter CorC
LDPSQHSSVLLNVFWICFFAVADCWISWNDSRNRVSGGRAGWPQGPALRVGVRAGLAFGLIAIMNLLGLAAPASIFIALALFLLLTVLISDHVLPRAAARRATAGLGPRVAADAPSEPPPALSVVASRAKRLEHVPVFSFMVPRRSIVCCDSSATVEEVASLMRETGLSRIIAYAKNLDRPLGLAHIKDVLPKMYGRGGGSVVESILRPLVLVPSSTRALDLLRDFQRLKRRVAIVRDLQGERTLGLVTTEDILEELVGEIHDEYEAPLSSALDYGVALVRADLKAGDLLAGLGAALESPGQDPTVGELVQSLLGKKAEPGDVVHYGDLRMIVEEVVDGETWMVRIDRLKR